MTCCTGNCTQGRACPARMAAEAATEVGAGQPATPRPVLSSLPMRVIAWAVMFPLACVGLAAIVAQFAG